MGCVMLCSSIYLFAQWILLFLWQQLPQIAPQSQRAGTAHGRGWPVTYIDSFNSDSNWPHLDQIPWSTLRCQQRIHSFMSDHTKTTTSNDKASLPRSTARTSRGGQQTGGGGPGTSAAEDNPKSPQAPRAASTGGKWSTRKSLANWQRKSQKMATSCVVHDDYAIYSQTDSC